MKAMFLLAVSFCFLTGCRIEESNPVSPDPIGQYQPGEITSPAVGTVYTQGSLMEIKWGGFKVSYVRLELLKKQQYYRQIIAGEVENNGRFSWVIPQSTPASVSYQVKLISLDDENDYILSEVFQIR
jgi:hypothetical protein